MKLPRRAPSLAALAVVPVVAACAAATADHVSRAHDASSLTARNDRVDIARRDPVERAPQERPAYRYRVRLR